MHELSIAEALLDQVRRHLPPGSRVLTIRVEAGARRCIEEQALNLAWEALTQDTDLANSRLELATLPWTLRCNTCNRTWQSPDPLNPCPCTSLDTRANATGDLRLLSIEIDNGPPNRTRSVSEAKGRLPQVPRALRAGERKTLEPPSLSQAPQNRTRSVSEANLRREKKADASRRRQKDSQTASLVPQHTSTSETTPTRKTRSRPRAPHRS